MAQLVRASDQHSERKPRFESWLDLNLFFFIFIFLPTNNSANRTSFLHDVYFGESMVCSEVVMLTFIITSVVFCEKESSTVILIL